jgi:ferredoxin
MKVVVDADVCAGHGVCVGLAADVFELTPEHEAAVRSAVHQCPTNAITITSWRESNSRGSLRIDV